MSRHDGPLWHGTDREFENFRDGLTFLSTSRDFAESYAGPSGTISSWRMPDWKIFDTTSAEDMSALMRRTGPIEDPYDGAVYETAESFLEALSADTWEGIEAVIADVRATGCDAVLVTEGGVVNFAIFSPAGLIRDDVSPEP